MNEQAVSQGELKRMMLYLLWNALNRFALVGERPDAEQVTRREPPALLLGADNDEFAETIRKLGLSLQRQYPMQAFRLRGLGRMVQEVLDARDVAQGYALWGQVEEFTDRLFARWRQEAQESPEPAPALFTVKVDNKARLGLVEGAPELSPRLQKAVDSSHQDLLFLARVMERLARLRSQGARWSREDRLAVQRAYHLIQRGVALPPSYLTLGTSGFRRYQTRLSLADPGPGHLFVTANDARLLDGTLVHVEHIDRDNISAKDKVEPYRLPAPRNVARVRLHVGSSAPVTAYVGRPMFENRDFEVDLLKSAHTMAATCSALFLLGVADCKIAIEGMTAAQAVRFMRVVTGNTVRDWGRQTLAAAFNIHTPILDDLGHAREVTGPLELAHLGIDLAVAGGFDKVAWDGASDQIPSLPLLGQLSFQQLLELVHRAHELGLETYMSAGMTSEHMREATFLGIGGVGIGTSMHWFDPADGVMGQLDGRSVARALEIRDIASHEVRGRAARWLAWLDRLYFERLLSRDLVDPRQHLFEAMRTGDESALVRLLADLQANAPQKQGLPSPEALEHPSEQSAAEGRASRVIQVGQAGGKAVGWTDWTADEIEDYLAEVRNSLAEGDERQLAELFS